MAGRYVVATVQRLVPATDVRTQRLRLFCSATNLVPVGYVVPATEHLVHRAALCGATYHLASPWPRKLPEVSNAFACAAGGPLIRSAPQAAAPRPTGP
ncbi:hypothetical protein AB0K15_46810 [Amycolatopsis sp. NPDC049253]|uniref:hypothetical protein n=1 Tax=Amycolatopsis sp. NPDC049253 TaxID=3155274 RepID=UPI003438587B